MKAFLMTNSENEFSVLNFLRHRHALLVHFSTVMSRRNDLLFPDDLRNAKGLHGVPLSFSTILSTDIGPHLPGHDPALANACGSVGIAADITDGLSVLTVGPSDDGTYWDSKTGDWISGGVPPTADSCARSIDDRKTANEWFVKDYRVIGLFVYFPILVRQKYTLEGSQIIAENEIDFEAVLQAFPGERIFSAHKGGFTEFDRTTGQWRPREYAAILQVPRD
jgi:hypothetical protein